MKELAGNKESERRFLGRGGGVKMCYDMIASAA